MAKIKTEELQEKIALLEKENAELKASQKIQPKSDKTEGGVTIQHIKPIRMWTVAKTKVLKVHRGTGTIGSDKFSNNVILTPGCVVTVVPELAKMLIKSKDFQKYGVER